MLMCALCAWPLAGLAPAGAACVSAHASVRVVSVQRTVIPSGTCVVPTPFTWWRTERVYHNNTYATVDASVGLPSPVLLPGAVNTKR